MFTPAPECQTNQGPGNAKEIREHLPRTLDVGKRHQSSTPLQGVDGEVSDEALVLLVRQGHRDAFAKLADRHFPTCLKRALLILRNHCDAEEQVQNAFVKAFEYLNQFRFEGPFGAWLCRIVENQCLMLIRERRQAELVSVDMRAESKVRLELVDQMPDQENDIGCHQVMNLLRREISHVPPLMRNVIVLRDIEGLPMPEVAARLGLSVPAAKSRLTRARRELRDRLAKYCGRSGPRTLLTRPEPNKVVYMRLT
jgi:RNA polymerase sigma-70 factor, ECF subfamily